LKLCQDRVREIGEFLAGRIEDGGTLLSELRRALDEAASRQATPPAQPAAGGSAGAGRSTMESVGSPEEADKALTEIRRLALAACAVLRESEPSKPLAYRLLRQMLWARVNQAPPASDGHTQIPAPGDMGAELQAALDRAEWKGVVTRAEDKLATSIFWLDLHRYTVAALDGMGETFAPAAEAVCEELALLLKRVPELPTLRFVDGSGLADDATRKWIQTRVAGVFGGAQAAVPATAAPAPIDGKVDLEEFEKVCAEARKLSGKKLLPQALRLLEDASGRAPSLPARAQWKLEMARLCLERGQPGGAEAMLENLDRELSQATYEDWRPELAAEILKTLLVCRRKAGRAASPEEAEKNRALLTRLYRIDVTAAMEVDGRS
jgi:type VI secretion system protein VasJ